MERGAKGPWAPGHIVLVLMLPSPAASRFRGLPPFSWALLSHFTGEEIEVLKEKAPASGDLQAPPIRDQQSFDPRWSLSSSAPTLRWTSLSFDPRWSLSEYFPHLSSVSSSGNLEGVGVK